MQIEIYNPTQAQLLPPVQWNYAEVKQWVEDGLKAYEGRVYTEETIAAAKKDRAALNKLADAIDDKRKEMKKLYLEPFEKFEGEAKELIAMIKKQSTAIGTQIDAFDELRKEGKMDACKEVYNHLIGDLADLVPYERLHNPKWLNVTTSMQTVMTDMGAQVGRISSGLASIDTLGLDAELTNQVKDVFLRKFDLAEALREKDRIIKQREALERLKATQAAQSAPEPEKPPEVKYTPVEVPEPATVAQSANSGTSEKIYSVTFRVHVTKDQLNALGAYMKANGIKPERV